MGLDKQHPGTEAFPRSTTIFNGITDNGNNDAINHLPRSLDLSNIHRLPYELRVLIWEATFEPRQISLVCESFKLNKDWNPAFKMISSSHASVPRGNSFEDYSAYLTCLEIKSPIALSVHHESREIALARYRPWKMFNCLLKVRNIMWYPAVDIVVSSCGTILGYFNELSFTRYNAHHLPRQDFLHASPFTRTLTNFPTPLPIFEKQFPAEVVEVKRLAIPSNFWHMSFHHDVKVLWPIIDFIDLRELMIVLNKDHEREAVISLRTTLRPPPHPARPISRPWTLPDDINSDVDMIRGHYEKYGPEYMPLRQRPAVRVLDNEAELTRTQNLNVVLRCSPCPYLDGWTT